MNIAKVINKFIEAQNERLQRRTFRQYEQVMDSFSIYLNGYGYLHVDDETAESEDLPFTKRVKIEELNNGHYREFFEYFLIRKMLASENEMKQSVTVLRKFANWLFENQYINSTKKDDLVNYFKDGQSQSLANSQKVNDLLYELAMDTPACNYEQTLSDYFTVDKVESRKLWVIDSYSTGEEIGPLIVTEEISSLVEEQWEISLTIGKHKDNWYVIESGNVYP